jgi:F0F1-type ATP synthase membrane subunit b/b'
MAPSGKVLESIKTQVGKMEADYAETGKKLEEAIKQHMVDFEERLVKNLEERMARQIRNMTTSLEEKVKKFPLSMFLCTWA